MRGPPSGTTGRRPRRRGAAALLGAKVKEIFEDSGGTPRTYGSPRVHAELRDLGWVVSEQAVAASMARQHLVARPTKRFRCLTRPDRRAVPFPDLVGRNFTAPAPNVKWCGDMERHEALLDRAVMKGHRLQPVAAGW